MTTVQTEQRTLVLLNRHHDERVADAGVQIDQAGKIGAWLARKADTAALTLADLDKAMADLQMARAELAEALHDVRCYESLVRTVARPLPIEDAARSASQPLPVLCVCDVHDRHPECGPDCPCAEPDEAEPDRTVPDGSGPPRTTPDDLVATRSTIHTDTAPVATKGGKK